jgi:hypothetical protein
MGFLLKIADNQNFSQIIWDEVFLISKLGLMLIGPM